MIPDCIYVSNTKAFTQVPNDLIRNPEMSLKAKMILVQLLSNKEGWTSHISALCSLSKDGETAIISGLKELENFGYLQRIKYRDPNKKTFAGSLWVYTDEPFSFDQEKIDEYIQKYSESSLGNHNVQYPGATRGFSSRGFSSRGFSSRGKSRPNNTNNKNTKKEKDISPELETKENKKQDSPKKEINWKSLVEEFGIGKVKLVKKFYVIQKENFPNFIKEEISPNSAIIINSLREISKLEKLDGFTFEQISKVLLQAPFDKFWKRQILKLTSLRNKSKNGSTKFENCLLSISESNDTNIPRLQDEEKGMHLNNYTFKIETLTEQIKSKQKRIIRLSPQASKNEVLRKSESQKIAIWEMIPSPAKLVELYLEWLHTQKWIKNSESPQLLDIEHQFFKSFCKEYITKIGFDIFTGGKA